LDCEVKAASWQADVSVQSARFQMNDPHISLIPRWYERIWAWVNPLLKAVLQISIILAALTFLQRQEPLIDQKIDHQSKLLRITRAGFSPVKVSVYAITFDINLIVDDKNHVSLNTRDLVKSANTRGFVLEKTLWAPWRSELVLDLQRNSTLEFQDWDFTETPELERLYCLAVEVRTLLSNQFVIAPILTPARKFSASLFGPMSRSSALGGNPRELLTAEAEIMSDCRALYAKVR
jgi:hypothetical protein